MREADEARLSHTQRRHKHKHKHDGCHLPVLQPTQHPVGRVSNVNLMFLSIHLKLPAD